MANIHEEHVVVTISKMKKDSDTEKDAIISDELIEMIEFAVQQIINDTTKDHIMVEVNKG